MSRTLIDPGTVNKLVALMEDKLGAVMPPQRADLRVVRPMTAAERAAEAWQWYEINQPAAPLCDVDQSPRARNIREINRIAMRHGWGVEVARAVDHAGVSGLLAMNDEQVDELAVHMRHLVDCAESGCDLYDALPAR